MRALILIHRYLGMVFGLLILAWFVSGFVMMFVQFPAYTYQEKLAATAPIDSSNCCVVPDANEFSEISWSSAYIEQQPQGPVLMLVSGQERYPINLKTGAYLSQQDEAQALSLAHQYMQVMGIQGEPTIDIVESDQWTVTGYFNAVRPFYKVALGDSAGTELYVSQVSGDIVLDTNAHERFWNWAGAIIHWLYPSFLRKNTELWAQVVIWLTLISLFLTIVGAIIGIQRFRFRAQGKGSPYRKWMMVHHYSGLIFGLLILTWLYSGLLSMSPWGWFEGRSFASEVRNLKGVETTTFNEPMRASITELAKLTWPPDTVRLEANAYLGALQWVARDTQGRGTLLTSTALTEALPMPDSRTIGEILRPQVAVASIDLLQTDDAYYFSHHQQRSFPVRRIIYEDGDRIYLDPVSGNLLSAVDENGRAMRWLFSALHRGDFAAIVRERPFWYFFVGTLLILTSVGVFTGCVMAYRRMRRWAS